MSRPTALSTSDLLNGYPSRSTSVSVPSWVGGTERPVFERRSLK